MNPPKQCHLWWKLTEIVWKVEIIYNFLFEANVWYWIDCFVNDVHIVHIVHIVFKIYAYVRFKLMSMCQLTNKHTWQIENWKWRTFWLSYRGWIESHFHSDFVSLVSLFFFVYFTGWIVWIHVWQVKNKIFFQLIKRLSSDKWRTHATFHSWNFVRKRKK